MDAHSKGIVDRHTKEQADEDALYNGVASHLDGWIVEKTVGDTSWYGVTYHYKLVDKRKTGRGISLHPDWKAQKVIVSGYWPKDIDGRWMSPRDVSMTGPAIGVGLAKTHEQIAKDIERRFLRDYHVVYDALQAKLDLRMDYRQGKMDAWRKLKAAVTLVHVRDIDTDPDRFGVDNDPTADVRIGSKTADGKFNYDAGYGDVRLTSPDSVEIHLRSVPIDAAIRVLKALEGTEHA